MWFLVMVAVPAVIVLIGEKLREKSEKRFVYPLDLCGYHPGWEERRGPCFCSPCALPHTHTGEDGDESLDFPLG